MEPVNREQIRFILQSAILAPSADNHHRLRFRAVDEAIDMIPDSLPSTGYRRLLAWLSLGAVAENLIVAASRFAIGVEVSLRHDSQERDLWVQFRLRAHAADVDPLWTAIAGRHTNRQVVFRGPPLSSAQVDHLASAVRSRPTSRLTWFDETQPRRRLLRLLRLAESERFRNRLLHEDLFSAIRFGMGWHHTCEEGLPPGSLGVELALRFPFALLRHWPIARAANWLGFHHLLGIRSADFPVRLAPHVGVISANGLDDQSVFDAGRSFQRLWLVATALQRVLQPLPASALYSIESATAEGIPLALQQELAAGWRELLGDNLPLMVFRMGSASPSPVVTGRKPLADYWPEADG